MVVGDIGHMVDVKLSKEAVYHNIDMHVVHKYEVGEVDLDVVVCPGVDFVMEKVNLNLDLDDTADQPYLLERLKAP